MPPTLQAASKATRHHLARHIVPRGNHHSCRRSSHTPAHSLASPCDQLHELPPRSVRPMSSTAQRREKTQSQRTKNINSSGNDDYYCNIEGKPQSTETNLSVHEGITLWQSSCAADRHPLPPCACQRRETSSTVIKTE